MRNRKSRLLSVVDRVRHELDVAETEIGALTEEEPRDMGDWAVEIDIDLEEMRERLSALEMRVEAIEGGPRA